MRLAIYFGEDGPEDSIYLADAGETYHSEDAIAILDALGKTE